MDDYRVAALAELSCQFVLVFGHNVSVFFLYAPYLRCFRLEIATFAENYKGTF